MSERPTPETDAACGYALTSHYGPSNGRYLQMDRSGPFVHAEVARRLERERDEALNDQENSRQSLAFAIEELEGWKNKWTCAIDMGARAELECDEAREAAEAFSALAWKLEGERNKARDALMEIKDRCVDREDACDDIQKIRDIAVKVLEVMK